MCPVKQAALTIEQQQIGANDHFIDAVAFRGALIAWGEQHFRSYPWRFTHDPYAILMAETMLHRTQAAQVVPVYERVMERYPEIASLAEATREELYQVLYSLGLRWRIDLIHEMAADVMAHFGGQIPRDRSDLLSLPGVSEYIAGAVRCFAWNLPEPLVDTNTVRIVGRLFGLKTRDSSRRNRCFRELIAALVDPAEPRSYSYALLDLAERVCMKKRPPLCVICAIQNYCLYGAGISQNEETDE
jgi:A/G-specific adenine glycosylase